ncbi:MAG: DUF4975 domain-containing protein [Chloroflexi bacterium]|nr:DUF4975 domain-containing protein [Chloroflexota bacterium]
MQPLFFKPEGAWSGDYIPFYKDGTFYLYYLLDWRDAEGHGSGTPWYLVTTTDFVHFEDRGEMLARGAEDEQERWVFTGSVIEGERRYHIFYTGHNPAVQSRGLPHQAIMHAVSDDLLSWQKVPADTFYAPPELYEPNDWRDPFVFWNDSAREYWMLICARQSSGIPRRRGCTALATSTDLVHWQVAPEPFYAPGLYHTHECPDLFRIGDWWYLVFSEYSQKLLTRYRMARSLAGPWITPDDDAFDGRAFYAAKTAASPAERYLFGWNPTRTPETDQSPWNWGGNLAVHALSQRDDGTLAASCPQQIVAQFIQEHPLQVVPVAGQVQQNARELVVKASPQEWACAMLGNMPESCLFSAQFSFSEGTHNLGVMLRASADAETGYYVRIEPGQQRLVWDTWPRPGDAPHQTGLERPLQVGAGLPITLQVVCEGTIAEVYVNNEIALSARMYDHREGALGVFVEGGTLSAADLSLHTR